MPRLLFKKEEPFRLKTTIELNEDAIVIQFFFKEFGQTAEKEA